MASRQPKKNVLNVLESAIDRLQAMSSGPSFSTTVAQQGIGDELQKAISSLNEKLKPISEAAQLYGHPNQKPFSQNEGPTGTVTDIFASAQKKMTGETYHALPAEGFSKSEPFKPGFDPEPHIKTYEAREPRGLGKADPYLPTKQIDPMQLQNQILNQVENKIKDKSWVGGLTKSGKPDEDDCCQESLIYLKGIWERAGSIDLKLIGMGGVGGPGGPTPKPTPDPKDFKWLDFLKGIQHGIDNMARAPTAAGAAAGGLGGASNLAGMLGFGGASSVLGIGALLADSVDKLRSWTNQLTQSNYRFAEFSASMKKVQVEQMIFDMQLSHERGERRAKSAEDAMIARNLMEKDFAKMDDWWNQKESDASKGFQMLRQDPAKSAGILALSLAKLQVGMFGLIETPGLDKKIQEMKDQVYSEVVDKYYKGMEDSGLKGDPLELTGARQYYQDHGRPGRFSP